ncbi:hypothetical protein L6259_00915 [Candidatus Parcubacteria bacterium]|nr:hypothetical protein [Patescibacteria group bacterium]MCG2693834.1 hypothetical protein [Candidatus Parcubacteria bacterium]
MPRITASSAAYLISIRYLPLKSGCKGRNGLNIELISRMTLNASKKNKRLDLSRFICTSGANDIFIAFSAGSNYTGYESSQR